MKTCRRIGWINLLMVVAALTFVACGNKQKNQNANQKSVTQSQSVPDSTDVVVEESEVLIVTDSIAPDTTAPAKQTKPTK
ncbi:MULTISPECIES: hypothetical protein [Porphyromonadaceae]|uniref:Lipoprotein n=1 Tax=Sanguibacteroides justesenii TaxID=1547597 RepID=A0AB34R5B0_9PORP|nr:MULTISPECIES: hypothetical protein [Porphyromonadaceae]KIO47061.1 hypothetical protein IE90_03375 [Sanguibacteroides justesenii]PXZ43710.1 hypothetical protein DMB45_10295 [Sanguibacteroides justesenii]